MSKDALLSEAPKPTGTNPKEHLVITAVGPDRVGLVKEITDFLLREGCNIEDSKMAVFCGDFTIILLVSGEAAALERVADSLGTLTNQTGLTVFSKKPAVRSAAEAYLPCRLQASCLDHPGVVHQLSSLLSKKGINIETMETATQEAPMSGSPIFQLNARLSVPTRVNLHELRRELDEIGKQENIDIDFAVLGRS